MNGASVMVVQGRATSAADGTASDHLEPNKNRNNFGKATAKAQKSHPTPSHGDAGCLSKIFFLWVNPVTTRCLTGSVEPKDLPSLSAADLAELKRGTLDNSLLIEERAYTYPLVLRATLREFWPAILTAILWSVVREVLSFANTFILKEILREDEDRWEQTWRHGKPTPLREKCRFYWLAISLAQSFACCAIALFPPVNGDRMREQVRETLYFLFPACAGLIAAAALSAVQLVLVFLDSHLDFYMWRVTIRVETALLTALYRRILWSEALEAPAVSIQNAKSYAVSAAGRRLQADATDGGTQTQQAVSGRGGLENGKGSIFNIMFVDMPSIAEMVLTSVDLAILPVRISLAAILLVAQVCTHLSFCLSFCFPKTAFQA